MNFNTIPEALQDLKQGKIILVTDDPDRENEGDFICAAEFATTENVNFMATHGKGLICMPMSEAFVQKLQFPQMVQHNTDNHETAFTVSIDHVSTSTAFLPQSVPLRRWLVWTITQKQKISADRVICSPFWQKRTVCWSATVTRKQPLTCAVWQG